MCLRVIRHRTSLTQMSHARARVGQAARSSASTARLGSRRDRVSQGHHARFRQASRGSLSAMIARGSGGKHPKKQVAHLSSIGSPVGTPLRRFVHRKEHVCWNHDDREPWTVQWRRVTLTRLADGSTSTSHRAAHETRCAHRPSSARPWAESTGCPSPDDCVRGDHAP
jgi:hypothetical protein